eukprot:3603149-Rhodomonas_salina.2
MVLEGPGGEQETLDVPWTVVYHPHGIGSWDKAGEVTAQQSLRSTFGSECGRVGDQVLCTERSLPPFDRNAACMSNAVTKRYSYGTTAQQSGVEMPMCSDGKLKRGGMEGRWFPVYNPAPSFAPPDFDCDRHGTFQILWNGLHTLGTSERAAAGMVMLDMGSMARSEPACCSCRELERAGHLSIPVFLFSHCDGGAVAAVVRARGAGAAQCLWRNRRDQPRLADDRPAWKHRRGAVPRLRARLPRLQQVQVGARGAGRFPVLSENSGICNQCRSPGCSVANSPESGPNLILDG